MTVRGEKTTFITAGWCKGEITESAILLIDLQTPRISGMTTMKVRFGSVLIGTEAKSTWAYSLGRQLWWNPKQR
jgi:hypothetical protein